MRAAGEQSTPFISYFLPSKQRTPTCHTTERDRTALQELDLQDMGIEI